MSANLPSDPGKQNDSQHYDWETPWCKSTFRNARGTSTSESCWSTTRQSKVNWPHASFGPKVVQI